MRIILKGSDSEVVLCDGPENATDKSRGPAGYAIQAIYASEAPAGIRAASILPIERANVGHVLRFGISRQCASHTAAILWANNHLQSIAAIKIASARAGTAMTLTLNADTYLRTITPVILTVADAPQFIGATVIMNYQLTFGAWPNS